MQEFDTEGDPAKATPVANQIAQDETFLGVIGGAFSGETRATKAIYEDAGLTMISPSATATDLTRRTSRGLPPRGRLRRRAGCGDREVPQRRARRQEGLRGRRLRAPTASRWPPRSRRASATRGRGSDKTQVDADRLRRRPSPRSRRPSPTRSSTAATSPRPRRCSSSCATPASRPVRRRRRPLRRRLRQGRRRRRPRARS